MRKSLAGPYTKVILAVVIWGATFVASKVALRSLSPDLLVWLRFGIGLVVLGAAMLARGQFRLPHRADLPYFALLGAVGITIHQWLQSHGLVTAQATTSAWIITATPVLIALLGWLVLGETLGRFQAAGVLVAVLGVSLVVTRGDVRALAAGQGITRGDALMLMSVPTWAVFSILSRRGLQRQPATQMMFSVMAFGWLFSALPLLGSNSHFEALAALRWDGIASLIFLGVFSSGLAYIFWYGGLQSIPASQAGMFLYIEPLVTMALAWGVLGERASWAAAFGGALTIAGIWMVNRRKPAR